MKKSSPEVHTSRQTGEIYWMGTQLIANLAAVMCANEARKAISGTSAFRTYEGT